jgi:exosome complex exonuclease RRP6
MGDLADFSSFQKKFTAALKSTNHSVNRIASEDINFHRSSSNEFAEDLDEQSSRLLTLTTSLLKAATGGTELPAPVLDNEDSLEDNWRGVVDVIDNLLEKADACLDEFTGVIKKLSPPQQDRLARDAANRPAKTFPSIYDYGPSKIPKPQLLFRTAPNNQDMSPFRPLLTSKPNAIVSLKKSLKMVDGKGKPALYVDYISNISVVCVLLTLYTAILIRTKKRFARRNTPSRPTLLRLQLITVMLRRQRLSGSIHQKA